MKQLVIVLAIILVAIVGFGFYEGWFRYSTDTTNSDASGTITVDKDKIKEDEGKVRDLGNKLKDKNSEPTDKVKATEHRP
jgi:hypothetical protein